MKILYYGHINKSLYFWSDNMEQRISKKINHEGRLRHPKHLGKDAVLLQLISALFTIAVALSNTFVNIYLWKLEKNWPSLQLPC